MLESRGVRLSELDRPGCVSKLCYLPAVWLVACNPAGPLCSPQYDRDDDDGVCLTELLGLSELVRVRYRPHVCPAASTYEC